MPVRLTDEDLREVAETFRQAYRVMYFCDDPESLARMNAVMARSCPREWCNSSFAVAVSGGSGRDGHAAGVGSMMARSSRSGAMVSRVM